MHSSSFMSTFVAGLAAIGLSNAAAIEKRESFCNLTPAAQPVQFVGGSGGGPWCESKWPGAVLITRITSYSSGNDITGLEIQYSDGNTVQRGKGFNTKATGSITLAPGELAKSVWLAGNGKGTRLGKIHIETNKQTQDLGTSDAPNVYKQNVGGGLLIGISGASGEAIDQAALHFLGPQIDTISINNYRFHENPATTGPPLTTDALDKVHFYNDGVGNQSFTFEGSTVRSTENTYKQSTTGTFGMDIKYEFEVDYLFLKGKVSTGISWSVSHTTETSTTTKHDQTLKWTSGGFLAANTGVACQALVQHGTGDFPYTAKVNIKLVGGGVISYDEDGTLHSVQYSTVDSSCSPDNTKQAGDGFTQKLVH